LGLKWALLLYVSNKFVLYREWHDDEHTKSNGFLCARLENFRSAYNMRGAFLITSESRTFSKNPSFLFSSTSVNGFWNKEGPWSTCEKWKKHSTSFGDFLGSLGILEAVQESPFSLKFIQGFSL
jgi:hypothetical protein